MEKVLVTGGAGFIGSNIVDSLVDNGFEVVVLDNLSSGKKENLAEDIKLINQDIGSERIDEVFAAEKPKFLVHHAAHIDVRYSVKDPVHDARSNILGSLNLLEACRKHGVEKIVYASSGGACYGEPQYLPADEKHPVNPLCPYGVSKHTVEHYLLLYDLLYGIDYTALRYGNVYGPRQDPLGEAGVIAMFTNKLLKGEVPVIFGDGEQTRDFGFVGDIAQANLLALQKKTQSKIFNIGTGVPTSVNEVTEKLIAATGASLTPEHGPAVVGEVRNIHLDASLAGKELGWKPTVDLTEGIKRTVEWAKQAGY